MLALIAALAALQGDGRTGPLSAADLGLEERTATIVKPKLVRRGQSVTLEVRSGALTITALGRALSDGREGEVIRVVTQSSRTIDGIVHADGAVRVAAAN